MTRPTRSMYYTTEDYYAALEVYISYLEREVAKLDYLLEVK